MKPNNQQKKILGISQLRNFNQINEKSEAYHCMGECDAGRLWVKIDEKGHNVKFGNIRLDTDYIKEGTDDIESKYIVSEDTNYMQGKCVPCL